MRFQSTLVLIASWSLHWLAGVAHASGFAIARFGGEHGTVLSTNPTALYYNPGAIGFSSEPTLFVDGTLALRSVEWQHAAGPGDVPEPAGYQGANYGTAHALNVIAGPMLGATLPLGRLVFGAAVYAPFGGSVSFDEAPRFAGSLYPGAVHGVARWHAYESNLLSVYGTVGAAYRLGPLSLGVGVNLIWTTLRMVRAQNPGGGAGINDLNYEGMSTLQVSGVQGSLAAGALLELLDQRLWLGVSYQAQPGLGEMRLNGTLEIDPKLNTPNDSLIRDVTFHQALPDLIRLGAGLRPSKRLELRVAGELTRWSVMRSQCVALRNKPCLVQPNGDAAPGSGVVVNLRRAWNDTIGVRAGVSYWPDAWLELFSGAAYETAAAPASTLDPVLADAASVAGALGARLEIARGWLVSASYTHLFYFSRNNTGLSTLADPETQAITRRPDGGGSYRLQVSIFNANLTKSF